MRETSLFLLQISSFCPTSRDRVKQPLFRIILKTQHSGSRPPAPLRAFLCTGVGVCVVVTAVLRRTKKRARCPACFHCREAKTTAKTSASKEGLEKLILPHPLCHALLLPSCSHCNRSDACGALCCSYRSSVRTVYPLLQPLSCHTDFPWPSPSAAVYQSSHKSSQKQP